MSITTIGYCDISPITLKEKIFVMILGVVAAGIFGYVINKVGSILSDMNKLSKEK